jgi:integral membrane protein
MKNPVPLLRRLALIEGVSFLLLLGVAMPLKYLAGMPIAVKIVGWAHGLLFVALCFLLLQAIMFANWTMARAGAVFVASLLPFGPFYLDRRMKVWEKESPPTTDAGEGEMGG